MYTKKEEIEKWLDQMSINLYTIRMNNIIDVHENVKIKEKIETEILLNNIINPSLNIKKQGYK